jgi:uncharacterized membrane protein
VEKQIETTIEIVFHHLCHRCNVLLPKIILFLEVFLELIVLKLNLVKFSVLALFVLAPILLALEATLIVSFVTLFSLEEIAAGFLIGFRLSLRYFFPKEDSFALLSICI